MEKSINPILQARAAIVYWARKNLGSTQWNESSIFNYSSEGGFSLTINPMMIDSRVILMGWKCNLFVADMASMAGAKTWAMAHNASAGLNMPATTRDPTASEWANANFKISGWTSVEKPQAGDVASDGNHMGIVSDLGTLISASSREGKVNETELYGMKYRRFIGLTEEEILGMLPMEKPNSRKVRCF